MTSFCLSSVSFIFLPLLTCLCLEDKPVPFVLLCSFLKGNVISVARCKFWVTWDIQEHSPHSNFFVLEKNEERYTNIFCLCGSFRLYSNLQVS